MKREHCVVGQLVRVTDIDLTGNVIEEDIIGPIQDVRGDAVKVLDMWFHRGACRRIVKKIVKKPERWTLEEIGKVWLSPKELVTWRDAKEVLLEIAKQRKGER